MSLDTVLKIGKAFRASENSLKHFRFVNPCPPDIKDKKGELKSSILRLSLPIKKDFSFDFDSISEITNENIIGSDTQDTKLYYLTFKTSDKDNNPIKYIFGDIYYGVEKGKDKGWYKTERKIKETKPSNKIPKGKIEITVNSFYEGNNEKNRFFDRILEKIEDDSEKDLFKCFRKSFERNLDAIETILKKFTAKNIFENILKSNQPKKKVKNIFDKDDISWAEIENESSLIQKLLTKEKGRVFLQFDLTLAGGKKYWYEYLHVFECIKKQLREEMTNETELGDKSKVFVFKKLLYRNICSGDEQGDKQFPSFSNDNRYKSFYFQHEDIDNLFYGINATEKGIYLGKDLINIVLLPNGENLEASHYEKFQRIVYSKDDSSKSSEDQLEEGEIVVKRNNEVVFNFLDNLDESDDKLKNVTKFDVVFVKQGQNSDNDLIEVSNIERSFLSSVYKNIKKIKREIYAKIKHQENFKKSLSIPYSLKQVLGKGQIKEENEGKEQKRKRVEFVLNPKYQSHLLKILPQIYTATYTNDNILLPAFIENMEYSIRQGDAKFAFLKYDLEFLFSIQNTQTYKHNYMKIIESQSYQIGLFLGKLARNFSGKNSPIKSFEKNYVGNLSRRIATLHDFISFKKDVEEKLIMHEKANYHLDDEKELAERIKTFSDRYDKNECAFGFFESYFDRPSKKTLVEKIEALLERGKADDLNNELIEKVNAVIVDFKTED